MAMRSLVYSGIVCMMFAFIGCSGRGESGGSTSVETIKVEAKPSVTTVYYSGSIKPMESTEISNTKAEGVIAQLGFKYGERVNKGQLLFVISSKQFAKDYQASLSELIKARQNLSNIQYQMTGTEELKKLKIVSEQEYLNVKSQLFNAQLEDAQADRRFNELLTNSGVTKDVLDKLDINNPKSIIEVLSRAPSIIKIYAPISGTALLPSGSKESGEIRLGTEVKLGQNLVSIAAEKGISVSIKATELDVNQLKVNQKAIISGDAFPGMQLQGYVAHVDRAANPDTSGGIPTFNVTIVYPNLTPYQDEIIRIGMRAEIAIPFKVPAIIKIPLTAITQEDDTAFVKKVDKKTGKIEKVPVQTRGTDVSSVEITGGLKPGDEVVVNAGSD